MTNGLTITSNFPQGLRLVEASRELEKMLETIPEISEIRVNLCTKQGEKPTRLGISFKETSPNGFFPEYLKELFCRGKIFSNGNQKYSFREDTHNVTVTARRSADSPNRSSTILSKWAKYLPGAIQNYRECNRS